MQEAAMKGWPKEKYLDRRKVIKEQIQPKSLKIYQKSINRR
jgi:hypothetical protein